MSFFESAGGMNVRGVTFNDHGSGNMTINNNQKYNNVAPGFQNTTDNVQDRQEMRRAFIDWKGQELSASLSSQEKRIRGPFFKSGGEVTIDGATFNDYGSGNATVNNNRTYNYHVPGSLNIVNSGKRLQYGDVDDPFPIFMVTKLDALSQYVDFPESNYERITWQQPGSYQPQAIGGQIPRIIGVPQPPSSPHRSSSGVQTISTQHLAPVASLPFVTPAQSSWSTPRVPLDPSDIITTRDPRYTRSETIVLSSNPPQPTISRPLSPISTDQSCDQPDVLSPSKFSPSPLTTTAISGTGSRTSPTRIPAGGAVQAQELPLTPSALVTVPATPPVPGNALCARPEDRFAPPIETTRVRKWDKLKRTLKGIFTYILRRSKVSTDRVLPQKPSSNSSNHSSSTGLSDIPVPSPRTEISLSPMCIPPEKTSPALQGKTSEIEGLVPASPAHITPPLLDASSGMEHVSPNLARKRAHFEEQITEQSDGISKKRRDLTVSCEAALENDGPPVDWDFDPRAGDGEIARNNTARVAGPDEPNLTSELLEILSRILLNHDERDRFCDKKGHHAQLLIDYLYSVLLKEDLPKPWLRRHCLIALYKLCKSSNMYPQCYTLKETIDIPDSCEAFGGFSDIRKGKFGEKEICLKVVRLNKSNADVMLKRYAKEAILWGQLNHPNIAPFYGIYYLNGRRDRLCLVSPWMDHGHIIQYLERNPSVYDVVAGLDYVHNLGLIHSDLKGANILVNVLGQACITDFGMSLIHTNKTLARSMITSTTHGFTQRWASPELLGGTTGPSMASDIWALGCVCYEIMTGKAPFYHLDTDYQIITALLVENEVPKRPSLTLSSTENIIWEQAERCWIRSPDERPKCREILVALKAAEISREHDPKGQNDAQRETLRIRDAMRTDSDDCVDVHEVKRILDGLHSRVNP